jgi:hypothetical protein
MTTILFGLPDSIMWEGLNERGCEAGGPPP